MHHVQFLLVLRLQPTDFELLNHASVLTFGITSVIVMFSLIPVMRYLYRIQCNSALSGLPIRYSVIVALTGLPMDTV